MMEQLSPELVSEILAHLGITAVPTPSFTFLDQLMAAYCRTVPWESVFRIVRRATVADMADCPRWPVQFWQENLTKGAGGTCFESNYAYLTLLQALGFEGYLTINNMGGSIGCHSAIVVMLAGQKWLVDAGFPIYASLPISPQGVMHRTTRFLRYTVRPDGENRYQIEQWPHPRHNAFTLVDKPISEPDYRTHATADYGENGLFLDAVIINKVVGSEDTAGRPWRFNMRETPWRFHRFEWGVRTDVEIDGDAATAVAHHFGLDEATVQQAFGIVKE